MPLDAASQQVISALSALSQAGADRQSQLQANDWLTSFQHSREAWQTCHALLFSDEVGLDVKMFAGQTFRAKVTYDISELDSPSLVSLRSSLLSGLRIFSVVPGSRPILVQVCLAIADLAVQMMEWNDVVHGLVEEFGKEVEMVPALLEFLRVLPEEVANPKITITSQEMSDRCSYLLSSSAQEVLQLLAMYIEAPGVTTKIQTVTFQTLRSWLVAGELMSSQIAQTPLFDFSFRALDSPSLFDTAVDVLVDLIHETQEIDDNLEVIQLILPRVVALGLKLDQAVADDDPDAMRGLCRIFVEAGETYRPLIIQHPETFFPLVQAIGKCAAYEDLDIVRITFNFWYRLSHSLGKRPVDSFTQSFKDVYSSLVEIIIGHLQFPANPEEMNAEERDEFRTFRHTMGDTLKDCCYVLGSNVCLKRSYDLIKAAVDALAADPSSSLPWQAIEAPLFSMRSMGAEVNPSDNEVVPLIMSLLPSLPPHPNVRYAAILVIGRYSEWIDQHPEHLPFMLQYVSSGFEDRDADVAAASAQSMRYLCKDCKQHLVPYLPQLHTFLTTIGPSLAHDDVIQVSEAIAFVLSFMPVEDAAAGLRTFAMPMIQKAHELTQKQGVPSRAEFDAVALALEQLATFLSVLGTFGSDLPASCASTPSEIWAVIDSLLVRFGSEWIIAEPVCTLLRRGITFFRAAAVPIVPSLLDRMAGCFELSQISAYLWITGKAGSAYAGDGGLMEGGREVMAAFVRSWERETEVVGRMLDERQSATEIPDVLDDYVHLLLEMISSAPLQLLASPAFPRSFSLAIAALSLPADNIVLTTLDYLTLLLDHPAITSPSSNSSTPSTPISSISASDRSAMAQSLRSVLTSQGFTLISLVLGGLVTGYSEDAIPLVTVIVRVLAGMFGQEMTAWIPPAVEGLPSTSVPVVEKQNFLAKIGSCLSTSNPDLVKPAVLGLFRASRRTRERLRSGAAAGGRLSVGGGGEGR